MSMSLGMWPRQREKHRREQAALAAETAATEIVVPFPPSVNSYWRRSGARTILSREGRAYREHMQELRLELGLVPRSGRLAVTLAVVAPDRRRRDLDNLCKAVLDGLKHAGAYQDDSQIDLLTVVRREPDPEQPGIRVTITERTA